MIRLFVVDDHPIVRNGLRLLVDTQKDMEFIGEADNGVDALKQIQTLKPDVVICDIAVPRLNGIELLRIIRERFADIRTMVLSMFEQETYVHQAFNAGAFAYVAKSGSTDDLLAGIRSAARGEHYLCKRIQSAVLNSFIAQENPATPPSQYDQLSDREQQVFHLMIQGNTTAQMADALCVSPKTIEKHRTAIYRKIGINSPIELLKYAIRVGAIDAQSWMG